MQKEEGAKTVVVGGKADVQQQYCGTVGGQSTTYAVIDTEVKVCVHQFKGLFRTLTTMFTPRPRI